MTRRERRGFNQNRMRFIWKSVKNFYEIAVDAYEFSDLCVSFYYDTASANVDMGEYKKIVKVVGKCR